MSPVFELDGVSSSTLYETELSLPALFARSMLKLSIMLLIDEKSIPGTVCLKIDGDCHVLMVATRYALDYYTKEPFQDS